MIEKIEFLTTSAGYGTMESSTLPGLCAHAIARAVLAVGVAVTAAAVIQGSQADSLAFHQGPVLSTVSMHTLLMSLRSMLRLWSSHHESDTNL